MTRPMYWTRRFLKLIGAARNKVSRAGQSKPSPMNEGEAARRGRPIHYALEGHQANAADGSGTALASNNSARAGVHTAVPNSASTFN